jgi:hypothetical protein
LVIDRFRNCYPAIGVNPLKNLPSRLAGSFTQVRHGCVAVAKRLRQRPALENVVLVAMTGHGQESDRQRSQEAGFDHHLSKLTFFGKAQQILATIIAHSSTDVLVARWLGRRRDEVDSSHEAIAGPDLPAAIGDSTTST